MESLCVHFGITRVVKRGVFKILESYLNIIWMSPVMASRGLNCVFVVTESH